MSDSLQQQSVKSAEKLFSDALNITQSLYKDKCEEVSGKYLAEAERLKKLNESSGQKWKELDDIAKIGDKLEEIPAVLTQSMQIDRMMEDYKNFKEEIGEVSETMQKSLEREQRKPRTTIQKDVEGKVSIWILRMVEIGWRMELLFILMSIIVIILSFV